MGALDDNVTRNQRLDVGKLSGAVHYVINHGLTDNEAIAELHGITTDPTLLGIAAGAVACDPNGAASLRIIMLAGADPDITAEHAKTVEQRQNGPQPSW